MLVSPDQLQRPHLTTANGCGAIHLGIRMLHLDYLEDRAGANIDLVAGSRWAITHGSFANNVQQSSRSLG